MRRLIMLSLLALASLFWTGQAWAGAYSPASLPNPRPASSSHVANPDQLIAPDELSRIDQLLTRLEADTGVQVAVVAVDAIESPSDAFEFSQQLFSGWGIGHKGKDDGLLVLLVKGQRTVRMHTGYGLEGILPDLRCHQIEQQFMTPAFKAGSYGEGLLAGLTEVDRILRHPDAANLAIAPMPAARPEAWQVFRWVAGIALGVTALLAFAIKSMFGYFSAARAATTETPLSMRYSRKAWLAWFLLGPIVIVAAFDLLPIRSPVWPCLAVVYGYFCLVAAQQAWRLQRYMSALRQKRQYFRLYQLMAQQRAFWGWMAVLLPLPLAFYAIYIWGGKTGFREHPRACTKCGQTMHKLTEAQEDVYLTAAQQKEESLQALDHDIWQCQACNAVKLLSYPGTESKYEKCPSCKSLTYLLESDTVLSAATEDAKGKGERTFACQFCGVRKTIGYNIARVVPVSSSSSSDSGSSSSSGSSWGGGSSGGGGASSNW